MAHAGRPDRGMIEAAKDCRGAPTAGVTTHVAVCCITFRRPEGLERLLQGLNGLVFIRCPQPRITVIVVDNDATAPMRPLVDGMRPTFQWQLRYGCEPVQGVSSARNRTLKMVPADADYLAFIDDDEIPGPAWLDELLHVATTYGAPIVQGPVRSVFLAPPPDWLVRGRFLELGPFEDGASLHFAATNNSLILADVVRRLQLRFDGRFNLTGGEDQRFFGCAIKAGHRVVTAEKASVEEWIPASRTTLRYLLQRKFRMGNTMTMIDRIEGGAARLVVRAIKGLGRIAQGVVQALVLWPRGMTGLATALCTMAWGAGALAGLFGVAHREYDTVHVPTAKAVPPSPDVP